MPFTLSHAAAVLPAVRADGTGRGRLVPAVLVAGSFAPDMTYYAASVISGAMEFGDVTHSFPGVFTVDVLVAWALVWLWLLVREPLVALLPRARQPRPAALLRCGARPARVRAPLVARWYASAALGALTHVVWDAFTHPDRWGVRVFPVLTRGLAGFPLYWYLQYAGSAVAAAVIAVWLARAVRRAPTGSGARAENAGGTDARTTGADTTGTRTTGADTTDARTTDAGVTGAACARVPGVPLLSVRDRWWAGAVVGGCTAVGAVERATRWWTYRGATAELWELIPGVCFGAGAGLVLGLLLHGAGVRVWRPVPASREPERVSAEGGRPAGR
ncbi:DUF4184 family protein [Streptomyces sediminimaris]|uniref:DUF4184 family protein n=1 Tax=Streptomyces sediminimaris TaxID=3383721 RepID=UPI00399B24D0